MKNTFHLVDYKEKFTVIMDSLDELDGKVGTITREQAKKEVVKRTVYADYYGVSAYYGKDKELSHLYKSCRECYRLGFEDGMELSTDTT